MATASRGPPTALIAVPDPSPNASIAKRFLLGDYRLPRLACSLVSIFQFPFSDFHHCTRQDSSARRIIRPRSRPVNLHVSCKANYFQRIRGGENETTVGFSSCFGITRGIPCSRTTRRGAGAESAAGQP